MPRSSRAVWTRLIMTSLFACLPCARLDNDTDRRGLRTRYGDLVRRRGRRKPWGAVLRRQAILVGDALNQILGVGIAVVGQVCRRDRRQRVGPVRFRYIPTPEHVAHDIPFAQVLIERPVPTE